MSSRSGPEKKMSFGFCPSENVSRANVSDRKCPLENIPLLKMSFIVELIDFI